MKLNEICEVYSGYALKAFNDIEDGLPVVKIGNILTDGNLNLEECQFTTDSVNEKYYSNKGDIYIALSGATTGKIGIMNTDEKYVINQRVGIVRQKTDDIPQEYIKYFLLRQTDRILQEAAGCAQPNISPKQIAEYMVPDISKDKMQEICDVLDKIKKIIDSRKAELSALDDLIKARFVELFENIEKKVAISSLCDVSGGYSFKSGDITADGSVRILQIGNVYLDDVNWETTNYLPEGFDDTYSRFLLNEGDIVIALTRPIIQSLGNVKACVVKESDTPCLLNQRVGRIVSKQNVDVSLKFIYGCLMTDDFTRYVESCCIGCSQPNISTKDIENYMVPDVNYEEQMKFVRFVEQVDKSKFVA